MTASRRGQLCRTWTPTAFLTLQHQEVVLVTFTKRDELDNVRVVGSSHNLNLLEDVGSLKDGKTRDQHDGECGFLGLDAKNG